VTNEWYGDSIEASLAGIREALDRMNDGRDDFHREVLSVLTEAKKPRDERASGTDGPRDESRSCIACGRIVGDGACSDGLVALTRRQWLDHLDYATEQVRGVYGACPETDAPEESG
jgi:hypothetical protein